MQRDKRIDFWVNTQMHQEVKLLADKENVPISTYLRILINEKLRTL